MKKLLLAALALTAVAAAQARTLSPEEALQRALSGASSQAKAVALTAPELGAEGSYKGSPSYYVFSNDKAAVIVSAFQSVVRTRRTTPARAKARKRL